MRGEPPEAVVPQGAQMNNGGEEEEGGDDFLEDLFHDEEDGGRGENSDRDLLDEFLLDLGAVALVPARGTRRAAEGGTQ